MTREERLSRFNRIDLYPVTCARLSEGRSTVEVVRGCISGGAKIVQLREKELGDGDLYRLARECRELTAQAGVLLMINDRVDIALGVGADGVHIGQDDFPLEAARRLGPELILGQSTHSLEEALQAQQAGADYVNIGPIFPTATKDGLSTFLGPEVISRIGPHLHIPFTVMGGINQTNLSEVLAHGAGKVAVVTAVTRAADIAEAVERLRNRIIASRV